MIILGGGGLTGGKVMAFDEAEPTVYGVDDDEGAACALGGLLDSAGLRNRIYRDPLRLLAELSPDSRGCVIADLRMPQMSGLLLQRTLLDRGVSMPLILISGAGDVSAAVRAIKQGAVDFMEKPLDSTRLLERVGQCLRSDALRAARRAELAECERRFRGLTEREREVLHLVVQGASSRRIADGLRISRKTVDVHRSSIFAKTGLRTLPELIRAVMLMEREGRSPRQSARGPGGASAIEPAAEPVPGRARVTADGGR
jgi:two-component system response regulator TtrR